MNRLLPAESRPWLVAAGLGWLTALANTGWRPGWLVIAAAAAIPGVRRRPSLPALSVLIVATAAMTGSEAEALPQGPVDGQMTLVTTPTSGAYGPWAIATVGGADVFVALPPIDADAGDVVSFTGVATSATTQIGGRSRQVVEVDRAEVTGQPAGLYQAAGAAVRRHVVTTLHGGSEARGLLAGFLVGDVSGVGKATIEEMRSAGLSHFVAVSGSNVALYLGLVSALALPMGIGPRRRAMAGLLALPVFVIATGFEPSVLRAAAMAGVVLTGRLLGFALEAWQVVSVATVAVLAYDPWLAHTVGLQLSLAATCGVLLGARWPGTVSMPMRMLRVSIGAQVAVAPLLLAYFGTVPLLSPLSNLMAAPLVGLATTLGMIGVAGFAPALVPGEWLAAAVIDIAGLAAGWPQVGWPGFVAAVAAAPVVVRAPRRLMAPVALVGAAALVVIAVPGHRTLDAGEVAVLDIGQGDAILISGGDGHLALIDGGRDPALLVSRLREYGVRYLDLVVVTHGDADHAGGLAGLLGRVGIGEIWERLEPHDTPSSDEFLGLAADHGIPVRRPVAGTRLMFGNLDIEVLAPARRFESSNDQSIVLLVRGNAGSILLTGDIEVPAQIELPGVDVDILKVPHHGAATSDRSWLQSTGAGQAVISVGENDFGHPVAWVIDALVASGATVRRTDLEGDVTFDLSR